MPGIDITSPIVLNGIHKGSILIPEEISIFNDLTLNPSYWWVIPSYGRFRKKKIDLQKPLLFICETSVHDFRISFTWHSWKKIFRKFKFEIIEYKNITILPSSPISLNDLIDFLFSSEKDACIFLAERCRHNKYSKEYIDKALKNIFTKGSPND